MAFYYEEPSRTFSEYLLIPGYSSAECIPSKVSLKTPLVRFKKGEEAPISINIPMVSAIMQSVSRRPDGSGPCPGGGTFFYLRIPALLKSRRR